MSVILGKKASLLVNVTRFEITSNCNNNVVNVIGGNGFVSLIYHESVLENCIKATATIADTGYALSKGNTKDRVGLIEGLDLCGGEKVELEFVDGYGNKISFSNEKSLYIGKIRNRIESNQNMVFVIDLVTREFLINELQETRVVQRYDGKISDSVTSILKKTLKTEKNIHVDPTINSYSFNGHTEKPLYKCTWLAKRSVPDIKGASGKTAGYFFFENYNGFQFKSIDTLLDHEKRSYKSYIHDGVVEGLPPPTYDGKIVSKSFHINIDVQEKLMIGAYGTQVRTYDLYRNNYDENEVIPSESESDGLNYAGYKLPCFPKEISDKPTRIISKIQPVGILKPIKKSKEFDYDVKSIVAQSASRYNQLFTIKMSITIATDMSLRAGDLIFCDFIEMSSEKNQKVSTKDSGIYMISDVITLIEPQKSYTKLNLVRDSYGRKPNPNRKIA